MFPVEIQNKIYSYLPIININQKIVMDEFKICKNNLFENQIIELYKKSYTTPTTDAMLYDFIKFINNNKSILDDISEEYINLLMLIFPNELKSNSEIDNIDYMYVLYLENLLTERQLLKSYINNLTFLQFIRYKKFLKKFLKI